MIAAVGYRKPEKVVLETDPNPRRTPPKHAGDECVCSQGIDKVGRNHKRITNRGKLVTADYQRRGKDKMRSRYAVKRVEIYAEGKRANGGGGGVDFSRW